MTRLNSGKKVEGLKVDKLYFYEYNILSFKKVKIQREKDGRKCNKILIKYVNIFFLFLLFVAYIWFYFVNTLFFFF